MASLTVQAAMGIALQCLPPNVAKIMAPIVVGTAMVESHLDPLAVKHNANGTDDIGIAQVNTSNFGWTGLTKETALDACHNFAAGLKVFFAKYNGNPPETVKQAYAAHVTAAIGAVGAAPGVAVSLAESAPSPCAPAWDA